MPSLCARVGLLLPWAYCCLVTFVKKVGSKKLEDRHGFTMETLLFPCSAGSGQFLCTFVSIDFFKLVATCRHVRETLSVQVIYGKYSEYLVYFGMM